MSYKRELQFKNDTYSDIGSLLKRLMLQFKNTVSERLNLLVKITNKAHNKELKLN
jgi:hypothetical protein